MTARIIELSTVDPLEEAKRKLREAVAACARAAITSGVPVGVINALRSSDAVTAAITVSGVPVTLVTGYGAMTDPEICDAWKQMLDASPHAGSRVHTASGRVLVELEAVA